MTRKAMIRRAVIRVAEDVILGALMFGALVGSFAIADLLAKLLGA